MQNEKNILRKSMGAKLGQMDADWRLIASRALANRLMATYAWRRSHAIGIFAGLENEVDTSLFFTPGKTFLYPKVEDNELVFYCVKSLKDLQPGAFGVPEPTRKRRLMPGLVLVPGLAFDAKGGRLGRGKGFYDRWLAKYPFIAAMGVGFDFQMVDKVPMEPHDRPMNWVTTEAASYP